MNRWLPLSKAVGAILLVSGVALAPSASAQVISSAASNDMHPNYATDGWVNTVGSYDVVPTSGFHGHAWLTPPDGNTYGGGTQFSGVPGVKETVVKTITGLTPGQAYLVEWYIMSDRVQGSGTLPVWFDVTFCGQTQETYRIPWSERRQWIQEVRSFTANATSCTLSFTARNDTGNNSNWIFLDSVQVAVASNTDFGISATGPSTFNYLGASGTVSVTVDNSGPTQGSAPVVTYPLPSGVSAPSSGGVVATAGPNGAAWSCAITSGPAAVTCTHQGPLAVGTSSTFTFAVTFAATGTGTAITSNLTVAPTFQVGNADPNSANNTASFVSTASTTACGNGNVEVGEDCDDGNTAPGDGCSANCTLEPGWTCDKPVTLTGIVPENYSGGNGSWTITNQGRTGLQTVNSSHGTFGRMGAQAFAATYTFDLRVTTSDDDDFIGFALGFSPGETGFGGSTNYLLLDWKQGNQTSGSAYGARGLALSHVTGTPSFDNLWGHQSPVTELVRANTRSSTGWADLTTYTFEITYTASTLRVVVDGTVEFNRTNTDPAFGSRFLSGFPDGEIVFYGLSQERVQYTVTGPFGSTQCNRAPVAGDAVLTVAPGTGPFDVDVVSLFSDPDGDSANPNSTRVTVGPAGATAIGAVNGGPAGVVRVTPNSGHGGQVFTFSYEICDDDATIPLCDTGVITLIMPPCVGSNCGTGGVGGVVPSCSAVPGLTAPAPTVDPGCGNAGGPLADVIVSGLRVCSSACEDWEVPAQVAIANRGPRAAESITVGLYRNGNLGQPAYETTVASLASGATQILAPVALSPEQWGGGDLVLIVSSATSECRTADNTIPLGSWPYPINDPDNDRLDVACDNCGQVFNPGQVDGDGDGAGDACDPCTDDDGDGWGVANAACVVGGAGCALGCGDCDDDEGQVYPGQVETCDGVDNNCSGDTDDEDLALVRPLCLNQSGVCGGARAPATYCVGGDWLACDDAAYALHSLGTYDPNSDACDGLDNDCDGVDDEDFAPQFIECGVGQCYNSLTSACLGSLGVDDACVEGQPSAEVCNGLDDDCDGVSDALDPTLVLPTCELGQGVCAGATKEPTLCVNGAWRPCPDTLYTNHAFPAVYSVTDLCDGADNDCNGLTDDDFLASPTTCGVGQCQGSGVATCIGGVPGDTCVAANPQTEVCDGVDNDCDGVVDGLDDSLLLIPCDNQKGVCAGAMRTPELCSGGSWQACPPSLYAGYALTQYSQLDLCDSFDNDCDGDVDEDFVGGSTTCGLGECTSAGTLQCVFGQVQSACVPGLPSAEVCNGLDNDCNGLADVNLVGANACPGLQTAAVACPPPVTSLTDAEAVFKDLVTPSNGAFQCSLDGQPWYDCSGDPRCTGGSGPQNCQGVRLRFSDLSTGSHTLLVRAMDPAGAIDQTPAYCAWTVDATVPDTLLLTHPDLLSQSTSASFTFGSNIDNVDTFMCALDAGTSPAPSAFVPCAEVTQYQDLAEGSHTLVVYVVSADGVADDNPVVFTWVIDLTAPDTAITEEVGAVTCDIDATFAFSSSSEDHAGFRCRLSQLSPEVVEGTFGTCNQGTFTAAGLADGVYTFEVAAYDIHGSQDPSPASRTFRVDTVTPDTFIDAAPDDPSTSSRATFAFSSTEDEVTYRCAVLAGLGGSPEASDWAPCSATPTFEGLADGPHTLFVVAADLGCLVDESPASYSWIVDTTLPATAFITTPPRLVGSGESSAFTYHDPNAPEHDTFECRHNDGEWFACDGGAYDLGVLDPGEHTFMVRSCSAVSDLCVLDPEAYTWNVTESPCPRDLEGPELTCAEAQVVECADGAGAVVPATFPPTMSDACGVAWSEWSGPDVFVPGTSLVVFTAADHNDNLSSCVTNVNVVDTTPPTVTCPEPRAETTPESGCTVAVDFGVVAGADVCSGAAVTVVDDAPLAYTVGETTVRYTAVDLAGNAASCTTTVTVTDDVPPFIDCVPTATRNAEADACHWRGAISATASDNCSSDTVTLGELKSYPVGEHTVDFEATDDHDNTGTCQSALTVLDVTSPEVDCGTWDAERDRVRVSAADACTATATALEVRCVLADGQVAPECHAGAEGDVVTVTGGIGVPFTLRWIARGEDPSGNVTNIVCEQPLDLDTDGDGVVDSEDNCPLIDNPDQANANGSQFGDLCDPTPFIGLGTEGGGGCASGPLDAGLPLALLFSLGLALWFRRRSRATTT